MNDLRTLARQHRLVAMFSMSLLLVLALACAPGELKEGLAPNDAEVVAVAVSPEASSILVGDTVLIHATATGLNGQREPAEIEWSASGGTVVALNDSTARFGAASAGSYRVRGRHKKNATTADSTIIVVTDPAPVLQAVILTPGSASLTTGSTQQFSVSGQWSNGATTAPSVTYSATGGSISANGLYTAGSTAGTFRVIATQQGGSLADTSLVTLTVSSPPGSHPNEPAGYSLVSDRAFNAVSEDGWGNSGGGNIGIVGDGTAPMSPSNIMRVTYPAGYAAGDAPWHGAKTISGSRTELYYHWTIRHSANFQGNGSGTNKIGYVWIHGNPAVFFSAEGSGSGPLKAQFRLQNTSDGRGQFPPNQGVSGEIVRGVWNEIEVQIVANTPGVRNGVARWWLNGVKVGEYTDILFAAAGQSNSWQEISIYPIWGGVTGTVSSTMTLDFDNIYVSGR